MHDRRPIWIAAGFAILLVNAAYLAAFAEPSLFYFFNVVLHVILGIAVTIGAVGYVYVRRPAITAFQKSALAVLAAGSLAGLVLTVVWQSMPTC